MDDVSDHRICASAGELREQARGDGTVPRGLDAPDQTVVRVPVTPEEIAILRAFLSAEIDAIIYGDEQLPRE